MFNLFLKITAVNAFTNVLNIHHLIPQCILIILQHEFRLLVAPCRRRITIVLSLSGSGHISTPVSPHSLKLLGWRGNFPASCIIGEVGVTTPKVCYPVSTLFLPNYD